MSFVLALGNIISIFSAIIIAIITVVVVINNRIDSAVCYAEKREESKWF